MDIYFDRIKPLFDGTGLNLQKLAKELSVPVKMIYNWNAGVKSYDKYYQQIADYFHVSVAYLKGETDEKSPPQVGVGMSEARLAMMAELDGMTEDEIWDIIESVKAAKAIIANSKKRKSPAQNGEAE